MRPPYWQPPVELSPAEQSIIASIKRAKTLVNFRKALIKKGFDQRLVERTVEIAKLRGGFSSSKLRADARLFTAMGSSQSRGYL